MGTRIGVYRHFRGGLYITLGTMTDATNGSSTEGKTIVHYVSLKDGKHYAREEEEFHECVWIEDGTPVRGLIPPECVHLCANRFTYVDPKELNK